MKALLFILPLMLLRANAERLESLEWKFAADIPAKMEMTSATLANGKMVSYQGIDEKAGLIYMLNVDLNRDLMKDPAGEILFARDVLEANLLGYSKGYKVRDDAVKKEWRQTFSRDSLFFTLDTVNFAPAGERTFHTGLKFWHQGVIFTLQVVSVGDRKPDAAKALDGIVKAFVLLDSVSAPANPKK